MSWALGILLYSVVVCTLAGRTGLFAIAALVGLKMGYTLCVLSFTSLLWFPCSIGCGVDKYTIYPPLHHLVVVHNL